MIAIIRTLILRFNGTILKPLRHPTLFFLPHDMNPSMSSNRLGILTQQLRLYRPPPLSPDDFEESCLTTDGIVPHLMADQSISTINRGFVPRVAAVLVCIYEGDNGDLRVILTKRSQRLSSHSGEVSLPGGKQEEADKDIGETAKREAYEEIGLDPSLVNVVTTLRPLMSKHNLVVVPVLGILTNWKSFTPAINVAEVEEIFDVPLEMFIKDENHRVEEREMYGAKYLLQFFNYESEDGKFFVIWGLTASVLIRVACLVYQKPPQFPVQDAKVKFPPDVVNDSLYSINSIFDA